MNESVIRTLLELQGVGLPPERAESIARAIALQIEAERAATRALEFEQEPAGFTRTLAEGAN